MTDYSEVVKEYIEKGFSCLPVKQDKRPAIDTWGQKLIESDKFKNCYGIGVICGTSSSGLECLDIDNHFGDAEVMIQTIEGGRAARTTHGYDGGTHFVTKESSVGG